MRKQFRRSLGCLLLALLLGCLCACGEENPPVEPTVGEPDVVTVDEPLGAGFTQNHAIAGGFGLGADTLDDIRVRYGEPEKVETQEYTALTITTADYSFGQFVFQGAKGETPVLTYAGIRSQLTAPMGVSFGQNVVEAVEIIYTGSAEMMGDTLDRQAVFYGDGTNAPTGYYGWLTMEYTSSTTAEKCAAEYIATGYDEGAVVKYCLYFDGEGAMVWYELQYLMS